MRAKDLQRNNMLTVIKIKYQHIYQTFTMTITTTKKNFAKIPKPSVATYKIIQNTSFTYKLITMP